MGDATVPQCTRQVLGIDTPDDTGPGLLPVGAPSPELLDRALVGWERFLGSKEPSDG
ncbi:hypothetical protein ACFXKW_00215 [Streptomyces sp. NPDC059193]|uniref:hypothetical protein n=1 Tax=Streptomyces sp. NPDC059193 TaxID=3346763 RepID=UPI003697712B